MDDVTKRECQEIEKGGTAQTATNETDYILTREEKDFLTLVKEHRPILLDRLQSLGLLSSFLEVENETKPTP